MKPKKGDLLVAAAVLVICALCVVPFLKSRSGGVATVMQDGKVLRTVDLEDTRNEGLEFTVTGRYNNVIKVSGGEIEVQKSDCPDKSCVKCGAVSGPGKVIACLPNGLIITVASSNTETDVISG